MYNTIDFKAYNITCPCLPRLTAESHLASNTVWRRARSQKSISLCACPPELLRHRRPKLEANITFLRGGNVHRIDREWGIDQGGPEAATVRVGVFGILWPMACDEVSHDMLARCFTSQETSQLKSRDVPARRVEQKSN